MKLIPHAIQRFWNGLPLPFKTMTRKYLYATAIPALRLMRGRPRAHIADGEMRSFGQAGCDVFFGYYDICPFDATETRLLAQSVRSGAKTADILCYDLQSDRSPSVLAATPAWCWQQGARLTWWDSGSLVAHNDIHNGIPVTTVRHAQTGHIESIIPHPMYDVSSDRRLGLSLNFARLQRLRPGYGYKINDSTAYQSAPETDGIMLVETTNGAGRLLLSLADAASLDPLPSMADAEHYFNHAAWAPDGRHFLVFHLWTDGRRRQARALVVDVHTGAVTRPAGQAKVSHYAWLDEDHLLLTGDEPGRGFGYHLYHRENGWLGQIGAETLHRDGHPSPRPGASDMMITDTYPDRLSERHLLCVTRAGHVRTLASLFSPPLLEGEHRCDLHPRWSPSGRMICVDSAHLGRRQICVLTPKTL
ncbi:MAG: hypothetical protein ACK4GK_06190 [Ferrovibrio sp.]